MKPEDFIRILRHLRKRLPDTERITSYARSHTMARISDDHLRQMAEAGLNRIHIGMESGSDQVLSFIKKGTTKQEHIKAGRKVKKAGMELSEYVMPGMGGRQLGEIHARETADALNQINPDFIRLRTLAVSRKTPLNDDRAAGRFESPTDLEMAREILLFLQCLDGIASFVKSDHFRNLLEEVDGRLPADKARLCRVVQQFLDLPPKDRVRFQMGRRMGLLRRLDDMNLPDRLSRVDQVIQELAVTPENVDAATEEFMSRFL